MPQKFLSWLPVVTALGTGFRIEERINQNVAGKSIDSLLQLSGLALTEILKKMSVLFQR